MFHVKHFGTIGTGNLTRPHTIRGLETSGIAPESGIFDPSAHDHSHSHAYRAGCQPRLVHRPLDLRRRRARAGQLHAVPLPSFAT
jgi:hypothetical protein